MCAWCTRTLRPRADTKAGGGPSSARRPSCSERASEVSKNDEEQQACGLSWRDGAKQVGRSLRAMALRHPRAFALVAAAASDEPPLLDFARRLRDFYVALGAPIEAFVEVWSVLDAFETGFLLLETQAVMRRGAAPHDELDQGASELADRMPATLSEAAYEEGLEIIVGGLERRLL